MKYSVWIYCNLYEHTGTLRLILFFRVFLQDVYTAYPLNFPGIGPVRRVHDPGDPGVLWSHLRHVQVEGQGADRLPGQLPRTPGEKQNDQDTEVRGKKEF